jgi:serine/threonine protein kinase
VLDLGLGAFVGVANEVVSPVDTDEGFVVGTTDYMSPEQLTSQPVDARTDLFSLGCTMYRLLTGAFAFPGATQMDRLTRRLDQPHVPISQVRKELPVPLIAVLDRLLSLSPDDRFSSAEEVVEALESLLSISERRGQARSVGSAVGLTPRPAVTSPPASEPTIDWTMVETALGPKARQKPQPDPASTLRPRIPPSQPSSRRLNSYRSSLEEEGVESGRSVQAEYRKEVIQLNRALADERSDHDADEQPTVADRWLEKVGEHLGDFLAEPTAGHIILILLAITFSVVVAFVYALS